MFAYIKYIYYLCTIIITNKKYKIMKAQEIKVSKTIFLKDIELGFLELTKRISRGYFECKYYSASGEIRMYNIKTF
jgi:hypothetical protein